jgi:hypothetical protein
MEMEVVRTVTSSIVHTLFPLSLTVPQSLSYVLTTLPRLS